MSKNISTWKLEMTGLKNNAKLWFIMTFYDAWWLGTSLYTHRELIHLSNQSWHPDNKTHQGITISQPHMGTCVWSAFLRMYIPVAIFTPHVFDVSGVIVLTLCVCVCLSVRLSVSLSQPKGQKYRLEFRHGGQVKEYLGQVNRSRS